MTQKVNIKGSYLKNMNLDSDIIFLSTRSKHFNLKLTNISQFCTAFKVILFKNDTFQNQSIFLLQVSLSN